MPPERAPHVRGAGGADRAVPDGAGLHGHRMPCGGAGGCAAGQRVAVVPVSDRGGDVRGAAQGVAAMGLCASCLRDRR